VWHAHCYEEVRGWYTKTPCSPDGWCSTVSMFGSLIREVLLLVLLT